LWRGLLQMTRTTPRRRMSLQFSQILFTDARTFMAFLDLYLNSTSRESDAPR